MAGRGLGCSEQAPKAELRSQVLDAKTEQQAIVHERCQGGACECDSRGDFKGGAALRPAAAGEDDERHRAS